MKIDHIPMTEQELMQEIIHQYDEALKNIDLDTIIPRDKAIIELTHIELETLQKLIENRTALSLNFEFFDITLNKTVEIKEDFQVRTIFHQSQNYCLKSISFNYASAIILISLVFKEPMDQLINEVITPKPIDKKDISLAMIIAIICFSTFFITYGGIPEILSFALFGAGFSALGFIYEKVKDRLNFNSKRKINERRFYTSQYLTAHLAEHAHQRLNLDSVE
ncbi:hypothetical protein AMD27_10590 [Acinetobacter sp. TGL-Y2]|nr:hypothetical protein AMD27_10590 [Acinetobacter sp. TGL-Y2]